MIWDYGAKHIIYNDTISPLIDLYNIFYTNESVRISNSIKEIINDYGLSNTSLHGYDYYNCDSSKGIGTYNKKKFLQLRNKYNQEIRFSDDLYAKSVTLFTLIIYAFNNQIRFNKNGEFNLAVGKRDFNKSIQDKLTAFINRLQTQRCIFTNKDFKGFDFSVLDLNDLVYCDPPYLGSVATYNESNGWTIDNEKELLELLDSLNDRKIRFALSNNLKYANKPLEKWKEKYNVYYLSSSYSNCSYQKKDKSNDMEILITNY